ncbi:MAG: hypothetical protein LBL94_06205 [Prevotellaceae bacterium]|jgi:hypothetical protein|nr:hypothetical protein [Prevotellaceae bacterium]
MFSFLKNIFRSREDRLARAVMDDFDIAYNLYRQLRQQEIDRILDKISEKGVACLTRKERKLLEKR